MSRIEGRPTEGSGAGDSDQSVALAVAETLRVGGRAVTTDPRRVHGMVNDLLGPAARTRRAEVDAVVMAAEEGVVDELIAGLDADDAVRRLHERGLRDDVATFAVQVWSYGLGLLDHAEPPSLTASAVDVAADDLDAVGGFGGADGTVAVSPAPGATSDAESELAGQAVAGSRTRAVLVSAGFAVLVAIALIGGAAALLGRDSSDGSRASSGTTSDDASRVADGDDASRGADGDDGSHPDAVTAPASELISGGVYHTCAIAGDASISCWGSSTTTDAPTGAFTSVSVGSDHSCAVAVDGSIDCWGSNDSGKANPPKGTYTAVSAGGDHTCAISTEQAVECWGSDEDGQSTAPSGTFVAVSAGEFQTCALDTGGAVTCWGDTNDKVPPTGKSYVAVSAGWFHACALATDGSIDCWGSDSSGQVSPPKGTFRALDAGRDHSCAIDVGDEIVCWGSDDDDRSSPPDGKFTAVAGGAYHSCAIGVDGTIACWGGNKYGQASPPPA